MTVHIWYSAATDITGRALAEALNANGVREKPRNIAAEDILVGWGVKSDQNVNIVNGTILNHPNAIRANRNKFKALELMKASRDLTGNIAFFCKADQVQAQIRDHHMNLPLIGRKNYHQGGSGLWLCITNAHVEAALAEGAQYFQSFLDIKDEYRLHVFCGKVIYAVKKVENATEAGWVAQRKEKVMDYAQKNNIDVNQGTLDYVLSILFKEQQLPDRIVRSNHRGWKFTSVALNGLPAALKNAAIKAVEVMGLDFGAVDCCLDRNDHPWVIEINSGPGLQGTTMEKYVEAFRAKIAEIQRPARVQPAAAVPAPRRQGQRRQGAAVGAAPAAEAQAAEAPANPRLDDNQLRMMMNAVNTPEEARRLLDIAMGRA